MLNRAATRNGRWGPSLGCVPNTTAHRRTSGKPTGALGVVQGQHDHAAGPRDLATLGVGRSFDGFGRSLEKENLGTIVDG